MNDTEEIKDTHTEANERDKGVGPEANEIDEEVGPEGYQRDEAVKGYPNDVGVGVGATLNRYTGNIVDWNRVGELLKSQNHRYSLQELSIRLSIILGTIVGTYVLASIMSLRIRQTSSYLIAFLLSFTMTHGIAIESLIKKRLEMIEDIEKVKKEIEAIVDKLDSLDFKEKIKCDIDQIMKFEAKNNASSATLGMRKRLLSDLLTSLL